MTNRIQGLFASLSFRRATRQLAIYLPLILVLASGCNSSSTSTLGDWITRSEFEGVARTSAAGFTIGTFFFIGTGSDRNNNRLNDFWSYDQSRNAWLQLANFPGVPRYGGVGFSIGSKGYIGLGIDVNGNRLKDFYEFTPASDYKGPGTWRKIADFGGTARINAVSFTIGNKGYVGTGDDLNYTKDFWAYDPTLDQWSKIASYSGSKRIGAAAFVINGLGYVGTGNNNGVNQIDWWAYDPTTDTWLEKNKFTDDQKASIQRSFGVGFTINGKGYLCQGANANTTVWEYDPVADTWTERGVFEGAVRPYALGFSLGSKGYVATGGSTSSPYDDLWQFDPTIIQDTANQ